MKLSLPNRGFKLIEVMFTTSFIGVFGSIIYTILITGTILGAKNTAVNTAHQQARTAMLQMLQDLHSSVSIPQLIATDGSAWPDPLPGATPSPAPGVAFQLFGGGPYKIVANANSGQKVVKVTPGSAVTVGQLIIIPFYQIEDIITAYNSGNGSITLQNNLTTTIKSPDATTGSNSVCYVTDRCSYTVNNGALQWKGPTSTSRNGLAKLGDSITSSKPFSLPTSSTGAPDYLSVTAIDLSTSDAKYNNRGFKSANILLDGQVPIKARLSTYQ